MSVLEFIERLVNGVAWPVVVLILGYVLRSQVGSAVNSLARRITHGKVGPVEADFSSGDDAEFRATAAGLAEPDVDFVAVFQQALSDAVDVTDVVDAQINAPPANGAAGAVPPAVRGSDDLEAWRRAQIEVLVDLGAKWGWAQAQSGAWTARPHPVVLWDDDDEPSIQYGTTDDARIRESIRRASIRPTAN